MGVVANERRIRANFLNGTVDDNPLAVGATTLTSSALASFPVVDATNHAMLVLDPNGIGGTPEVVMVTAHGAGATTATIVRAQEGTVARSHAQTTPWTHSALASDLAPLSQDPIFAVNATTGTLGDEFSGATLDSSWVRVDRTGNAAPVTWTQSGGMLSVKSTATDTAAELHALMKPLGGATFPLSVVTATRQAHAYATNYQMMGLILADGVTYGSGTQLKDLMYVDTTTAGLKPSPRSHTGYSTDGTTYDNSNWNFFSPVVWRRWDWTAANTFTYSVSPDGISWIQLGGTISLTFTPTHAGMYISHWGQTRTSVGTFEFFRIT